MTRSARVLARAAMIACAALAGLFVFVATGSGAAATNPPIAISDDGVTYGANLPGNLFDGVLIVPGGSVTRPFWVKNTGPSGANLAVTLIDVGSADPQFLAALTIVATSGTHSGGALFSDAGECVSLIHALHLAPGQSARVDTTLTMANVSGTTAQGSQASFNLGVNLTSDDVPAPNGCVVDTNPTPTPTPTPNPTDNPGDGGGNGGGGGTVVVPGIPSPPTQPTATPSPTISPEPTPTPSVSPSPDPSEPAHPGIKGNTDRFYQEWFVAGWVVAFILGGYLAWRAMRTRYNEGEQS